MSSQREEEAHTPRLEAVIQVGHTVSVSVLPKTWRKKNGVIKVEFRSLCGGVAVGVYVIKKSIFDCYTCDLCVTPVTLVL